jgi:hypothetical protein
VNHPPTLFQSTTLSFFQFTQVVKHGSLQHLEHGAGQGRCLVHAQHSFQYQTFAPDLLLASGWVLAQYHPFAYDRQSAQDRARDRHLEHGAVQGRFLLHAQHSFQHQTLAPDDFVASGILVQPLACHRQSAQDRGRGRKLAQEQQSSQRQHRDQEGQSEDQGNSQRLRPAYDYLLDSARRCA